MSKRNQNQRSRVTTKARRRRAIRQSYGVMRRRHRELLTGLTTKRPPLSYYRRTQPPRSVREHRTAQWNRRLQRTAQLVVHTAVAARALTVALRRLSTVLISVDF